MALDRQRILGELGSVMKQLQSADCGCLGKLFGNSHQAAPPMMGSPLPTCGGCRRACCHGHGYPQAQYNSPTNLNLQPSNVNYTSMDGSNPSQSTPGNMYGIGPQIVNMMKGDHTRSQYMTGQPQGQVQGHIQGQMSGPLAGPMVIDAPQSPHGKVGITPFTPPSMIQGQFQPNPMNQGDIAGQMQNQFTPNLTQSNANGNTANMSPWSQNINSNSAVPQSVTPEMNPWPQQNMTSYPATQTSTPLNQNPHGQHAEGIAKFNKMFPGVKQGMGGDLGFDPMAIAIQMNPDNHLQSAMDTMHKIMNGNKGMDQIRNNQPAQQQLGVAGNIMNQSPVAVNGTLQQNAVPDQTIQSNNNQLINQQATSHNIIPNEGPLNQQYTYSSAYGQPIPQQNQQIYATAVNPNAINQQVRYNDTQQLADQHQYSQQQVSMNLNSAAPNLPVIQQEETRVEIQGKAPPPEDPGYPAQVPVQQMIKEPILPVDTSKNLLYMPPKHQKNNNYSYNTLGQPVEMLPAKMYHPPEPSLPQTLSPQPDPVKSRNVPPRGVNVKATISKTSLMSNKPVGKTPSRPQLQHIYNQYKGSQSFTQQNVRHPGEGSYSVGKLNVPQTKTPPVPVERVGGDTVMNNQPSEPNPTNKVEQMIEQIGDVPVAKPAGGPQPVKDAPAPLRKGRNGLQDMVYTSYPTSAAWSFHGHGRNDYSPTRRFPHRRY